MRFHAAIPTKDVEASKEFYLSLGFEVAKEYAKLDERFMFVQLSLDGEFVLELVGHPSAQSYVTPEIPELTHLAVDVEDLSETLKMLVAKGAQILRPIMEGVAVKRFAFVADPSGFPVELVEPRT